jgi:hypothetical protein
MEAENKAENLLRTFIGSHVELNVEFMARVAADV